MPGVELRIAEDGELLTRGPILMRGYRNEPQKTAEAIDADGWLHTGDVAVMDERGYIDITDRMKDMFIVGGFNAYPAEIERILLEHPAIGDVAVIGVPDDRMGEVGRAFVTVRHGYRLTAGDVVEWARGAMANYKVPRHVDIVDDLPRNASGKALKHVLRERASGGVGRALG
jgi:acyl-CoA synthetase (AMP-forming)/AMP-acid ligase II